MYETIANLKEIMYFYMKYDVKLLMCRLQSNNKLRKGGYAWNIKCL